MQRIHQIARRRILAVTDFFYPLFRGIMPLQTFRYAACGGFTTGLDIVVYFLVYNYVLLKKNMVLGPLTVSAHIAALFFSFLVSFPTGFYLNRYVVWQATAMKKRVQLFRYMLVVFTCLVLNYIGLKLLVDGLGWYATPSKIVISVFVILFSYISQRHFSFKTATPS